MKSKALVALPFILIGVLLMSVSNMEAPSSNSFNVGGSSSHLSYISGFVTSINTNKKILQLHPEDNFRSDNDYSIIVDCSNLYPTEFDYSFDSISIGDLITIGYFPPLQDSIKAYCITKIHKEGDSKMENKTETLSRRNLIKLGFVGVTGAVIAGTYNPITAYASPDNSPTINPKLTVLVKNPKTGKVITSFSEKLNPLKPLKSCKDDEPVKIAKCSVGYENGLSLYSIETSVPISEDGYTEITEESSESLEVYAKVTLGVMWGEDHTTVQIQRGTFEVASKSPLVSYSNTSYAMMQKSRYIGDMFNGKETTVETNWPSDPFDSAIDINTCGGAVIGGGFDMLSGQEFWFQVEIYL